MSCDPISSEARAAAKGRARAAVKALDIRIGARLRRHRHKADMNIRDAALAAGICFQQLQKYESGQHPVGAAMLVLFAMIYKTTADQFILGVETVEAVQFAQEMRPPTPIEQRVAAMHDALAENGAEQQDAA